VPPFPEQRKISEILDTLDETIRKAEQLIAKLKQVKQGLLHDLLTRGIDDNGELRDPERYPEQFKVELGLGLVPKAWTMRPFDELCESSEFGPRFPSDRYATDGPLATLRTTDMNDEGEIDLATMPRVSINPLDFGQHLLRQDDLVISRSGTCGIAGVFPGHVLPVVPGAFLIRFRMKSRISAQLYRRYFNSPLGRPRLEQLAVGGVQKNIKGSDVLSLRVPCLPADEAKALVDVIGAAEEQTMSEMREVAKLRLLKSGLMEDLLTGRVRVTDIRSEVAA
jgi:type I restriction enzyme S subunit